MSFDTAFTEVVGLEGKYSDDPNDPGNWTGGKVNVGTLRGTMYGISAASYPDLDIVNLTLAKAKGIYLTDFWGKMKCAAFTDPIAIALFKQGVNMGCEGAVKALQRSLKTTDDGSVGQMTIGLATSGPVIIVLGGFLTECAYEYTTFKNFDRNGHGWLSRVIKTALQAKL